MTTSIRSIIFKRMIRLGEKLKKYRGESNLSIAKLAAKASVSPDYIHRIEHGIATNVGVEKLEQIASALGIPVSYFFSDSLPEEAGAEIA